MKIDTSKIVEDAVRAALRSCKNTLGQRQVVNKANEGGVPYSSLNSAERAIIDAARSLTPAPNHVPTEDEIRRETALGAVDETTRVFGVIRAQRGKAPS
jgi:hypothetical protein